jgi:hypothetical protein
MFLTITGIFGKALSYKNKLAMLQQEEKIIETSIEI